MRKSKRKVRDPKDTEKTYRVEYKVNFYAYKNDYYTTIHARNRMEVEDLFYSKFYNKRSKITDIIEC